MENSTTSPQITWLHGVVAGAGLLVFVLLFFADKTNLNNDPGGVVASERQAVTVKTPEGGLADQIPDYSALAGWDDIRIPLAKAKGTSEEADRLKDAVSFLRENQRLDAAAIYAGRLADLDPNVKNWLVAGAIAREAAVSDPSISSNEELFGSYMEQASGYLGKAAEAEPENQDVLIELGLAYISSGKPENSMLGIQQLLKVMELNPENGEAAFHLGMFSRQTGQWEKAANRFETVVKVDPQNFTAKYFLAVTYLDLERGGEAKVLLNEVIENSQEAELNEAARELIEKI